MPGGLKAALSRHPGSGIPGGLQGSQPEDQRRMRPSLCVYGHREGAMAELLPNKVTKAVSVGAGARTKSTAK